MNFTLMMPNGDCFAFDKNGRMVKGCEIKLGRPVKIEYTTISSTSENRTAVTECPADTD